MQHWLKLVYNRERLRDADYWEGMRTDGWISDSPGRRSRNKHHRPQYKVGDLIVAYVVDDHCCPAILRVTREPRYEPDRVERDSGVADADQWGCVTEVELVESVAFAHAPNLERIGVSPRSISQKGRVRLEAWQYENARGAIVGTRRSRTRRRRREDGAADGEPDVDRVPIEERHTERTVSHTKAEARTMKRRETKLVGRYNVYLCEEGDTISRHRIRFGATRGAMYSDLYNETRNQLVEAKTDGSRDQIRMAIGQLADYARFVSPNARRAVLLEARPHPDLEKLLDSQGIAVIWAEREGFADNKNGEFTSRASD